MTRTAGQFAPTIRRTSQLGCAIDRRRGRCGLCPRFRLVTIQLCERRCDARPRYSIGDTRRCTTAARRRVANIPDAVGDSYPLSLPITTPRGGDRRRSPTPRCGAVLQARTPRGEQRSDRQWRVQVQTKSNLLPELTLDTVTLAACHHEQLALAGHTAVRAIPTGFGVSSMRFIERIWCSIDVPIATTLSSAPHLTLDRYSI